MTTATPSAQILQRISSLPPLPAAIGRLLRLVNEPDADFKEIAKTISLDQTLTAQLLRIANSAFYGFPQQIRTVQQATVILGRYAVRNMALSLTMVRLRHRMNENGPLAPEEFWRHSMAVACGARMLAQHQKAVAPEEAFVAGLLHDIGKIVLVEHDPERYAELLVAAQNGIAPLYALERETFGIDHAEVGEALCKHWNIPHMLTAVVAAHHGGGSGDAATLEIVEIVNLADTLAKICEIGNGGNPHIRSSWLSGSKSFAGKGDRVRQILNSLREEVALNEQIFFNRPSVGHDLNGRGLSQKVRLEVASTDARDLLNLALRARGCTITEGPDAEAIIADSSVPASTRAGYAASVYDYSEWLSRQISSDWINTHQLHQWLSESFAALATAK